MIVISGANGVVGSPLFKALNDGQKLMRISRRLPEHAVTRRNTVLWDMRGEASPQNLAQMKGMKTLIHCAPIWLLPPHMADLKRLGLKRIVAFSSTSVTSKADTKDRRERVVVKLLADAEVSLQQYCTENGIALTVFRPSMIYGNQLDQNVMQIANFIKRFGRVILAGSATGLRQPVHADDLVIACMCVLENETTYSKTYELAGSEQLTYRAMVERIFAGYGLKPKITRVPVFVMRFGLWFVSLFGSFAYTSEMANRMNQDLVYDYGAATQDFLFNPGPFLREPEVDLGRLKADEDDDSQT